MSKNILQAVSGGYDSTYLLIKNLEKGYNVYPIFIRVSFINQIKQKIEYAKVTNLIRKLRKKYKNLHNLIDTKIVMHPIWNVYSTQPIAWLLNLFKEAKRKQYTIKYDEVHIGYIKDDCVIKYLPAIMNIWKSLYSLSDNTRVISIPKLCFPLSKYNKKQIIKKIMAYDKKILEMCWTCEMPKIVKTVQCKDNVIEVYIEACGSCSPCKNLKKTMIVSFENIKKYKAVFNYKMFRDESITDIDNIIKNADIGCVQSKYLSFRYANKKLMNKTINLDKSQIVKINIS